jgi:hypothetical protein
MSDVIVALGTIVLAVATYWLARDTRRLARSSEAELRSRWRPLVIPSQRAGGLPVEYDRGTNRLMVWIRNAGAGPALGVRVQLDPDTSPDRWSRGALGSGDEVLLAFSLRTSLDSSAQLLIDYRDLADREHGVSITLTTEGGRFVPYDVRFENHSVTTHGAMIYPQPGLRDVRQKRRRSIIERCRAAVRSFRAP